MHKNVLIGAAIIGSALLLAGCPSHKPKPTAAGTAGSTVPAEQSQTAGADASGAYGAAVAAGSGEGVAGPSAGQL